MSKKASRRRRSTPPLPYTWSPCGEITVANVGEHHTQLLGALQNLQSVCVELSHCTYLDVSALQLLVAVEKTARARKLEFSCQGASAELLQDAGELGLHAVIEDTQPKTLPGVGRHA
jgi:anti-anti-sigma regulatory factor